tara:strand:+ start:1700 stop:2095 length:396 start_codon:yes stop_codon:yes gene_type:complete
MQQFLFAIILFLGFTSYYLFNENKILSTNNVLLEGAVETQKETIATIQKDFALQATSLLELQGRNQEIQQEMTRYLDIFKRHNLTKLAAAKPGLLEPKINKGTKNVFNSIEENSRNIDSLDNGVQLQSNSD